MINKAIFIYLAGVADYHTLTGTSKQMDISTEDRQAIIDQEHLRLLSIGYYISGGLHIAFASLFIFHFALIILVNSNPEMFPQPAHGADNSPEAFLHIFAWFVGIMILLGWTFGGLTIYAGRCIKAQKNRTFSMVMAILNTLAIPVGTIVGVCGLLVLTRPSVIHRYAAGPPAVKTG